MKKLIACFIIAIIAMSFTVITPIVRHYPDIMIVYYPQIPKGAKPAFECFNQGVFLSSASDYFNGIDSVTVKYLLYKFKDKTKFETVYTNFYSRINYHSWKKYGPDKKFITVVTETPDDTLAVQQYSPTLTVVYYKVQ